MNPARLTAWLEDTRDVRIRRVAGTWRVALFLDWRLDPLSDGVFRGRGEDLQTALNNALDAAGAP